MLGSAMNEQTHKRRWKRRKIKNKTKQNNTKAALFLREKIRLDIDLSPAQSQPKYTTTYNKCKKFHFAFLPFCFLLLHFWHFEVFWGLDHFSKTPSQFMKGYIWDWLLSLTLLPLIRFNLTNVFPFSILLLSPATTWWIDHSEVDVI